MKKLFIFIIILLLYTTNIFAADEIEKGKTLLKSLSKKSLTKNETINFLNKNVITLEDERGDGVVTYVFDENNYKRYKDSTIISEDAWRFSKLGALRLFNGDIKLTWKIKPKTKKTENLINIKAKYDPIGKLYEFSYQPKENFLELIQQAPEQQKADEEKKKQEEQKLAEQQKADEEKKKQEEQKLAEQQKADNFLGNCNIGNEREYLNTAFKLMDKFNFNFKTNMSKEKLIYCDHGSNSTGLFFSMIPFHVYMQNGGGIPKYIEIYQMSNTSCIEFFIIEGWVEDGYAKDNRLSIILNPETGNYDLLSKWIYTELIIENCPETNKRYFD